jgi:hypothetical protein
MEKLFDGARTGLVVDLSGGEACDAVHDVVPWGADRQVPAQLLLDVLTGSRPDLAVHPRGVRLRGARIVGAVEWDWQRLAVPLELVDCVVDAAINLDHAQIAGLSLIRCRLPGLSAEQLISSSTLRLLRSAISGPVVLRYASISGAVLATGTHIQGAVEAQGEKVAVLATRAQITGTLLLNDGFSAGGKVVLTGARIGGNWDSTDATFDNQGDNAIWANGIQVEGNVSFRRGFTALGKISLVDGQIGGSLSCEGGTFRSTGRRAFRAMNLRVAGDVLFARTSTGMAFSAEGEFSLIGARIGGSLKCDGASFNHPEGIALNLENSEIEGNVRLTDGFRASGQVRLGGSRIGGLLNCGGGTFHRPGQVALHAVDAEIGDSVFLRPDFTADGEVRLHRARIGGTLDCSGGRFSNPGGYAVFARTIRVGAAVLLSDGFSAEGSVLFTLAQVTGDFHCTQGFFGGPESIFKAEGMTVTGSFRWRDVTHPLVRTLDLRRARVGELDDDAASWPEADGLRIGGFSYERLSDRSPRTPQARVEWIRRQRGFNPEPYQQLSAVYRSNGQISEATTVAIAQYDDLLARGDLNRPTKVWAWFLGRSIGHGYRPGRVVWALLVLYLVTFGSVWLGARADAFIQTGNTAPQVSVTASHCGPAYPCLSAPAYALENITPILNLHQGENWHPKSSTPGEWILRDWLNLSTVVGYAGTTLLAAALSGLTRKA